MGASEASPTPYIIYIYIYIYIYKCTQRADGVYTTGDAFDLLASWTDYTKTRQQWALTFSGPQIAKKLDL